MKLFYANTSPYARKCRVVAAEKGLNDRIDFVLCNPFEAAPALKAVNPLSKVPSLVLDGGEVLYDSPVICEYLDSLTPETRLIPAAGMARWSVLRVQALGDGLLDAAFAIVMERRRPETEQSAEWLQRWTEAIGRGVDVVESEIDAFTGRADMGTITIGVALGYLDFRLPDLDWSTAHPKTATWYRAFSERPSLADTRPES